MSKFHTAHVKIKIPWLLSVLLINIFDFYTKEVKDLLKAGKKSNSFGLTWLEM